MADGQRRYSVRIDVPGAERARATVTILWEGEADDQQAALDLARQDAAGGWDYDLTEHASGAMRLR